MAPGSSRVTGDLDEACIRARADLLVTRKPPGGFSLVSVVSPLDFEPTEVTAVVAAIAGGPHSELNVQVSDHLARRLNVDVHIATAYTDKDASEVAESLVARLGEFVPHAKQLSIQATDLTEFVKALPSGALLVLGEAGGSLLSRLVFGPGARLRACRDVGVAHDARGAERGRVRGGDPPEQRDHRGWSLHRGDSLRPGRGQEGKAVIQPGLEDTAQERIRNDISTRYY